MDFFENLFKLRPTKIKVSQNDVNMQEKQLKIFFDHLRVPRSTYDHAGMPNLNFLKPLQIAFDQDNSDSE